MTRLHRTIRPLARHAVVAMSVVSVTLGGSFPLGSSAAAHASPSPLAVSDRTIATDPAGFYLPVMAGECWAPDEGSRGGTFMGIASASDGFRELRVGDARVLEPRPHLLEQGSFVPYRLWEYPDALAVEFP